MILIDLNWCKKAFGSMSDVYFVSDGNSAELDLAILASCNHSIVDYGTFGYWASFLAGGQVVWAKDNLKEPLKSYPVSFYVRSMEWYPNWIFFGS